MGSVERLWHCPAGRLYRLALTAPNREPIYTLVGLAAPSWTSKPAYPRSSRISRGDSSSPRRGFSFAKESRTQTVEIDEEPISPGTGQKPKGGAHRVFICSAHWNRSPVPSCNRLRRCAAWRRRQCGERGKLAIAVGHPLFERNGNLPQLTVQSLQQYSWGNSHNRV
jgi:hypothetical protein